MHAAVLATFALLTAACDFANLSEQLTQADTSGAAAHDDGQHDAGHAAADGSSKDTAQHAAHTGALSAAAKAFDGELKGSGTPSVADPWDIPGPAVWFECDNTHEAPNDPIVFPGEPGASHMHTFFGNPSVDAHSTTKSLLAGGSRCDDTRNTSAYWFPQLRDGNGNKPDQWDRTRAYYMKGAVDKVQPMPQGLRMIAGDMEPDREKGVLGFVCRPEHNPGRNGMPSGGRLDTDCPDGSNLGVSIVFPNCWDGENLDSPDHRSHVRYDNDGRCPQGWVPIPQMRISISTFHDTWHGRWVTGGPGTGHADFFEAAPKGLMREIVACLNDTGPCPADSFQ